MRQPVNGALFDTHCHLGHGEHAGDTAADRIARARSAGVTQLLDVGIDLPTSTAALARARTFDAVYCSVGLHPNEAAVFEEQFARLAILAEHPRCVAIGETGFDFHWDRGPRELQERSFHARLELGERLGKPVVVHARDSMDATLALLAEHPGVRKIMHCFAGDAREAARAVELSCWISFAGPLTYPKADRLREAARGVPHSRLLVETDAPFLPPQSRRGMVNESACVVEVAQRLARERGMAAAELADLTTANARALLGIDQRGGEASSASS